ncbi:MAG: PHP domain-containing protein [Candidatus Delongbacteria bacterium]|nr:PHP domain-containing protein [Candidatus Delongbacteria bacterium]
MMKNKDIAEFLEEVAELMKFKGENPFTIRAFQKATRYRKILGISAGPYCLDLDWRWIKPACDRGIHFAINPDAHRTKSIDDPDYRIGIARKGGLTPADVINCYSIPQLNKFFKQP